MTKQKFMECLTEMYRVANSADSAEAMPWTQPDMARKVCRSFDRVVCDLLVIGILSEEERDLFYDGI